MFGIEDGFSASIVKRYEPPPLVTVLEREFAQVETWLPQSNGDQEVIFKDDAVGRVVYYSITLNLTLPALADDQMHPPTIISDLVREAEIVIGGNTIDAMHGPEIDLCRQICATTSSSAANVKCDCIGCAAKYCLLIHQIFGRVGARSLVIGMMSRHPSFSSSSFCLCYEKMPWWYQRERSRRPWRVSLTMPFPFLLARQPIWHPFWTISIRFVVSYPFSDASLLVEKSSCHNPDGGEAFEFVVPQITTLEGKVGRDVKETTWKTWKEVMGPGNHYYLGNGARKAASHLCLLTSGRVSRIQLWYINLGSPFIDTDLGDGEAGWHIISLCRDGSTPCALPASRRTINMARLESFAVCLEGEQAKLVRACLWDFNLIGGAQGIVTVLFSI